jgi:hypothetical protein
MIFLIVLLVPFFSATDSSHASACTALASRECGSSAANVACDLSSDRGCVICDHIAVNCDVEPAVDNGASAPGIPGIGACVRHRD